MSGRLPQELAVGFEELDGQHRLLLRDLEAAIEAVDAGAEPLRAALAVLGDAYVSHFSSEEALMAETLYPDRARHKGAHDLFMQELAQIGSELESFGLTPTVRHGVVTRIAEWTRFHIQVNDAPLGRYLASRRLRVQPGAQSAKPVTS